MPDIASMVPSEENQSTPEDAKDVPDDAHLQSQLQAAHDELKQLEQQEGWAQARTVALRQEYKVSYSV